MMVNQRKDWTYISDPMVLAALTSHVSPKRWICVSEIHKFLWKSSLCTAKQVKKYQFWHLKSHFLRSPSFAVQVFKTFAPEEDLCENVSPANSAAK